MGSDATWCDDEAKIEEIEDKRPGSNHLLLRTEGSEIC